MATKIIKRTDIDDSIYDELMEKYPPISAKGICYAQTLTYITVEVEEFNNPIFRRVMKENSLIFIVYMYLRERMCHKGWYIAWDEDTKTDTLERLTLWGITENESQTFIDILLEKGLIKAFNRDGITYLTDVQQIYNFEMNQAKRKRDRDSKQDKNTRDKHEVAETTYESKSTKNTGISTSAGNPADQFSGLNNEDDLSFV